MIENMKFPIILGFGTLLHVAHMSQSFNNKWYLECNLTNIQPFTSPTPQAVCHYTVTILHGSYTPLKLQAPISHHYAI